MTMLNKQAFEKACQKFDFMYFNSDGTMPIQAAIEEYVREADKTSGNVKTIIALLRDSVRHPDNDKLMQDAATVLSRIPKAVEELRDMIDGGEECRGYDSQLSEVIRILEGA